MPLPAFVSMGAGSQDQVTKHEHREVNLSRVTRGVGLRAWREGWRAGGPCRCDMRNLRIAQVCMCSHHQCIPVSGLKRHLCTPNAFVIPPPTDNSGASSPHRRRMCFCNDEEAGGREKPMRRMTTGASRYGRHPENVDPRPPPRPERP